jgi:hypothetical protein
MNRLALAALLTILTSCSSDSDNGETRDDPTGDSGTTVLIDAGPTSDGMGGTADASPRISEVCSVVCPALVTCGEFETADECIGECGVELGDCDASEEQALTDCVETGNASDCNALSTCMDAVACSEQ